MDVLMEKKKVMGALRKLPHQNLKSKSKLEHL